MAHAPIHIMRPTHIIYMSHNLRPTKKHCDEHLKSIYLQWYLIGKFGILIITINLSILLYHNTHLPSEFPIYAQIPCTKGGNLVIIMPNMLHTLTHLLCTQFQMSYKLETCQADKTFKIIKKNPKNVLPSKQIQNDCCNFNVDTCKEYCGYTVNCIKSSLHQW